MASRKRNSKQLKKRRTHKRRSINKTRSMKKRMRGGCGCAGGSGSSSPSLFKGGGDFFLQGYKEPPSFNEVPISKFYENNTYQQGTDLQGAQISSRLMPNMTGGKNMNKKKVSFSKKMKGGFSFGFPSINLFGDPLLGGEMNAITTQGGVAGAMVGSNIVGGLQQDNYSPQHIVFPKTASSLV
jgi:hypothetical protein